MKMLHDSTGSSLHIFDITKVDAVLNEVRWPARNLQVDPLSSVACWESPLPGSLISQKFETESFPPKNWSSSSLGTGWFRTMDGSSPAWPVPPGERHYACVNDTAAGADNNACCDYLIMPSLDLSAYPDYMLVFESYYDGLYGGSANLEYSTDSINWFTLYILNDTSAWHEVSVDLSDWSGSGSSEDLWIRFHYDDNGQQAGGWAVDNVEIISATVRNSNEVLAYLIDLNGQFQGTTIDTAWTFTDLVYGESYEAAVVSQYANGNAEEIFYSFTSTYLVPPDFLQAVVAADTVHLSWQAPDITSAENLLGYNVYRNEWEEGDEPLFFIDDPEVLTYSDTTAEGGNHQYVITALYDLTAYGYPGDEGESKMEGPVDAAVQTLMPFTEDWSSGSLDLGGWENESGNWFVNASSGNPEPAVEFNSGKRLKNYEDALISPLIYASEYSGALMFLSFDLKLDDESMSGTEKLMVRIYANDTVYGIWQMVNYSDVDWVNIDMQITEEAMGNDFRVGFIATGTDAVNINSWGIDNIVIDMICPAPFGVECEYMGDQGPGLITWQSPDTLGPDSAWIHYDDGVNFTGIGYDGPGEFDVAIRYEPAQLTPYDGMFLTKVRFFPMEEQCEYSIRVWTGNNASNLIADQPVENPAIGSWDTVRLEPPVVIDVDQELWIGYRNQPQEGFPAGADEGPPVINHGDMIFDEATGWISMSQEYGLDYNWNIQAYVTAAIGSKQQQLLSGEIEGENARSSSLLGYNVYYEKNLANLTKLNESIVTETSFIHEGLSFYDVNCYFIEAVYDNCVSSFSAEECLPTAVPGYPDNIKHTSPVYLYPNPAGDQINIGSSIEMHSIRLYSFTGQLLLEKNIAGLNQFLLGTSGMENGLYFIRIETTDGIVTKKVTIAR